MNNLLSLEWWYAAGIRAIKTVAQTAIALLATQGGGGNINWISIGEASLVAGIASLGTSLAGLPELQDNTENKAE